jgi:hypothetical protein
LVACYESLFRTLSPPEKYRAHVDRKKQIVGTIDRQETGGGGGSGLIRSKVTIGLQSTQVRTVRAVFLPRLNEDTYSSTHLLTYLPTHPLCFTVGRLLTYPLCTYL